MQNELNSNFETTGRCYKSVTCYARATHRYTQYKASSPPLGHLHLLLRRTRESYDEPTRALSLDHRILSPDKHHVEPVLRSYDPGQFLDTKLRRRSEIGHQGGGLQIELELGLILVKVAIWLFSTEEVGTIQEGQNVCDAD